MQVTTGLGWEASHNLAVLGVLKLNELALVSLLDTLFGNRRSVVHQRSLDAGLRCDGAAPASGMWVNSRINGRG